MDPCISIDLRRLVDEGVLSSEKALALSREQEQSPHGIEDIVSFDDYPPGLEGRYGIISGTSQWPPGQADLVRQTTLEQLSQAIVLSLREQEVPAPASTVSLQVPPSFPLELFRDNHFAGVKHLKRKLGLSCLRLESPSDDGGGGGPAILVVSGDEFQQDIATLELREVLSDPSRFAVELAVLQQEEVFVYVDNSNIAISAQRVPAEPDSAQATTRDLSVRVSCSHLDALVLGGRTAAQRICFGSSPPLNNAIWEKWRRAGYDIHLCRRAPGYGEQFVDDALVAQMQHTLLRYQQGGRTLVMLSGDGNDNGGRASFRSVVESAILHGWTVEVWSWRCSCSRVYRDYNEAYADTGRFKLLFLDEHRDSVTFLSSLHPTTPAATGTGGTANGASGAASAAAAAPAAAVWVQETFEEEADPEWMNCPIGLEPIEFPAHLGTAPRVHYEATTLRRWVTENGSCPLTRAAVTAEDVLEATEDFAQRLEAYWASVASSSGPGLEPLDAPAMQLDEGASPTTSWAADAQAAVPRPQRLNVERRVPCTNGPSCQYLRRPGGCSFYHSPPEVSLARTGGGAEGFWTCPACQFLNRPRNAVCGGLMPSYAASRDEPRRFGCGEATRP